MVKFDIDKDKRYSLHLPSKHVTIAENDGLKPFRFSWTNVSKPLFVYNPNENFQSVRETM